MSVAKEIRWDAATRLSEIPMNSTICRPMHPFYWIVQHNATARLIRVLLRTRNPDRIERIVHIFIASNALSRLLCWFCSLCDAVHSQHGEQSKTSKLVSILLHRQLSAMAAYKSVWLCRSFLASRIMLWLWPSSHSRLAIIKIRLRLTAVLRAKGMSTHSGG